jgi:predicted ferric reductase
MLIHFIFSFFCSIIFAFVLTYFLKRRAPGPFGGILYFLGIIFLFTAALGLLLTPIGPMYKNVPWLSIIAIGLLIMLLIAELLPHHEKAVTIKRKPVKTEEEKDEEVLEKEFGILIVFIIIILVAAIVYAIISGPDKFKMTF